MAPLPPDGLRSPYELATSHLERAQAATWEIPVDWFDLTIYGFYCLEAAVKAAAEHVGLKVSTNHAQKAVLAKDLAKKHGLPDVSELLSDLNQARKATGYGDVVLPMLDSDELLAKLEEFVTAVGQLLGHADGDDE
jgi:hypothetical protein